MDQHSPITPLATIVLTLLEEHPMHPYEAAYHFRIRHVEDYVKVRTGSLYHAFEQLQRRGLIEPVEVEREGRRPERTVYRITEAGRGVVETNMAHLVSDPVNEYTSFEAGLVSIAHLGKPELIRCLRERAVHLRARAAQQRTLLDENVGQGVPQIFLLELDHEVDHCITQAAWCDRTADAVERGDLPWPDPLSKELAELATYHETPTAFFPAYRNGVAR